MKTSSLYPIIIDDDEDGNIVYFDTITNNGWPVEIVEIDGRDVNMVEWQEGEIKENKRLRQQEQEQYDFVLAFHLQQQEGVVCTSNPKKRSYMETDSTIATLLQEEEDLLATSSPRCLRKQDVLNSLESCQLEAIKYVQSKAKQKHNQALETLKRRVVHKLGFSSEDLQLCLDYIRDDAPIVVHMTTDTLSKLVNDTHYRNLFETGTSRGCKNTTTRGAWERAMFGNAYDSAKHFDRPKYGCLNVSGDVTGVQVAKNYGTLVITLQPHVRHRCTFFNMDTGNFKESDTLATNDYYAHVLHRYKDDELTAILNICKNARIGGSSSKCASYKEVQIHGPINLATDVQSLSLPGKAEDANSDLQELVVFFQLKTKCNILWQEDILNR